MRETLTVRDRGIEALLAGLPIESSERDKARRYAVALTNNLARWDMDRRKRRVDGVRHG